MKNVDDLVAEAAELAEQGLSKGEIADELNVSRETASWLVERAAGPTAGSDEASAPGPDDVHVDWREIGRDSHRLGHVGIALADLLLESSDAIESSDPIETVVGIEKAGTPLATVVARELGAGLATYAPSKHQWEDGDGDPDGGAFSRNFGSVDDRACAVVDDTITSGTTMRETVEAVRTAGGEPVVCAVLADKRGLSNVGDVPVRSLLSVISVGQDR